MRSVAAFAEKTAGRWPRTGWQGAWPGPSLQLGAIGVTVRGANGGVDADVVWRGPRLSDFPRAPIRCFAARLINLNVNGSMRARGAERA